MDGSFRGFRFGEFNPWLSSPPRRSNNEVNEQNVAASSTDGLGSQRSPTSRRRRMLGRLARSGSGSGSDLRNTTSSTFNPDAPEFVPETLLKMPSKRKASSYAKPGKPTQLGANVDSMNSPTTDPPFIKSEDIVSANHSVIRAHPALNYREYIDSSDEDIDMLELSMLANIAQGNNQVVRQTGDFNSRMKAAEDARKRQDACRKSSAVLVSSETGSWNAASQSGGTDRIRYLPLCPATNNRWLTILPSHQDFTQRSERGDAQSNATWPLNELPVELFDLITTHLARDDVKCMRLVNREFEQKVSRSLFHTSVVPFNTEIYDMIDEDRKTTSRSPVPRGKGKGKMKAGFHGTEEASLASETGGLQWQNAKEDKEGKVYKGHGLRVFQGFGPHIKRFGMSFEISEKQLSRPPIKKELDHIESYHGSYDWPSVNYARFATLAGLENTADETSRMKAAFSNLEIVQELALSVDSGLGWLNGPDKSLHALIFEQPTPVFGSSYSIPDHAIQAAEEFWTTLQQSQQSFDPHANLKESSLEYRCISSLPAELEGLRENIYSNTQLWSVIDRSKLLPTLNTMASSFGVLHTTANQPTTDMPNKFSLMPGDLSKEQKEWLLETQWAQQAFLESYMLAVIDNPKTFKHVTSLNIAKLSSRFLPMLAREVFWDVLPCLSEVILLVSADWRNVEKDDAGFAQTTNKYPSEAARMFHREVLHGRIAPKKSIKKLCIGWVGGGEHAEGMFARNGNVLPAPLTRPDHCTANSTVFGLIFEHVEHLTLANCWITPPTLEGLVKSHSTKALKKLTLDSVSLTAHPRFPSNIQGAGAQQFAQAMAAMQAQLANNIPAVAPLQQGIAQPQPLLAQPQPMNPQQMVAIQQQFNQHIQQIQQIQQQANQNVPFAPLPQIPMFNGNNVNIDGQSNVHWTSGHREGSWPQLLDIISPGIIFDDYLPAPAPWEASPPPRPETTLQTIEFKSCGYAKLPNHTGFDQLVLEPAAVNRHTMSQWFRTRCASLKSAMMTTNDRNIGQVVQHMPWRELNALQFAWGLTEGWQDRSKAEQPEFDGFLPGGTGRFSGIVEKGMTLFEQPGNSNAFPASI